ncbi:amino acid transporter [Suhomyces tanzawaensis NRRL Y-17324]|uniref:Amino acid transporter n=1 Tax=Suhomyces tanzawaensis NRRL Y-17324 TaxID=984487 RepID=A0A1E4SPG2_9ASCO|nr:amino acid transporter [Suhomyces tanzawaensis NRRL Y-17324]ODV81409.1 amino acid transporter [Suhomyces tanzawaensis NRRL Y-17324]
MSTYLRTALNPFIGGTKQEVEDDASDAASDAQLSVGAPIEGLNPLGYNIDYFTAYFTALHGVIGTGIFATPASVLKSMGSIGASYVLWIAGFIIAVLQIFIWIEFVTYFKRRSGGQVVYLEQAFPKPKFMVSSVYAAVTVILSFSTSSAIAFAQYILAAADHKATAWEQRGVGIAVLVFVSALGIVNSRLALKVSNFIGFVKVVFILFIAITGLVVLGGHTRVKNPTQIFQNSWEGTVTSDGNAIASAILKVSFSYGGTQYLFNVAGESNPKQTKNIFKYFLPAIMLSIFAMYLLIITAFYAGINDIQQIKKAGPLISSLFFTKVFGTKAATKALDVFVALSALGHLLAVVVGQSRALRECGRQGVLPYSSYWVTTKPWGTPILPIVAIFIVNFIVLVAPPAGDAYNFVVDIGSFSGYIFNLLLVIGLLLVRRQRKAAGLGFEGFKTPLSIIIIIILYGVFVIAMSFVPPPGKSLNGSDVSFFYATYAFTSIGILLLCFFYYYIWAFVLPRLGKYAHRNLHYTLENGERGHTVVKVPVEELEEWDSKHDSNGKEVSDDNSSILVENIVVSGLGKKD